MKSAYNLFDEMPYESYDNPFAEPRTVPMGWGPDVAYNQKHITGEGYVYNENYRADSETSDEDSFQAEKFPKPRTTPKHWDVSALK